jgi:hypothetical protein
MGPVYRHGDGWTVFVSRVNTNHPRRNAAAQLDRVLGKTLEKDGLPKSDQPAKEAPH